MKVILGSRPLNKCSVENLPTQGGEHFSVARRGVGPIVFGPPAGTPADLRMILGQVPHLDQSGTPEQKGCRAFDGAFATALGIFKPHALLDLVKQDFGRPLAQSSRPGPPVPRACDRTQDTGCRAFFPLIPQKARNDSVAPCSIGKGLGAGLLRSARRVKTNCRRM